MKRGILLCSLHNAHCSQSDKTVPHASNGALIAAIIVVEKHFASFPVPQGMGG